MNKQNTPCPFYRGVCGISEDLLCYSNAASCDIYRDYLNEQKKKKNEKKEENNDERR